MSQAIEYVFGDEVAVIGEPKDAPSIYTWTDELAMPLMRAGAVVVAKTEMVVVPDTVELAAGALTETVGGTVTPLNVMVLKRFLPRNLKNLTSVTPAGRELNISGLSLRVWASMLVMMAALVVPLGVEVLIS